MTAEVVFNMNTNTTDEKQDNEQEPRNDSDVLPTQRRPETNPLPQHPLNQELLNPFSAACYNNPGGDVLRAINPAQLQSQQQAQNQMMLMAQMLQLSQQQPLAGQMANNNQVFAHLMNIQQQQQELNTLSQMNLWQSMARASSNNAMQTNPMGIAPAQQQMNQFLLGLAGNVNINMGGLFSNPGQLPNNIMPSISAAAAANKALPPNQDAAAKPPAHTALQGDTPLEDPGWEDQFKALQRYRLVNGHTKVPARYKENPKLGRWVMTQRRQMALMQQGYPNALTVERIAMLDEIGFAWSVRPEPVSTWNKKMEELKQYKQTFGNTMVPQRYQANPQLGTWVHTQRRQYKLMQEGKKSSMTQDKIDALNAVGFVWVARSSENGDSSDSEDDGRENSDDNNVNEKEDQTNSVPFKTDELEKCEKELPSDSKGDSPTESTSV
eukprot:CCRYP_013615-RA/>CCRYP_013615-RA protein AED:0.01 eAED:0.01 QI:345/1/1/1/1/1/2/401/437